MRSALTAPERPDADEMDGLSPEPLLQGDWSPDDPGPRRVLELARSLTGSPAT